MDEHLDTLRDSGPALEAAITSARECTNWDDDDEGASGDDGNNDDSNGERFRSGRGEKASRWTVIN